MSLDKLKTTINKIKMASVRKASNDNSINRLKVVVKNIKALTFNSNISLEKTIKSIRESYIGNWESNNMDFVSRITNHLKLDEGIPLPVLSICGKGLEKYALLNI